MAAEPKKRKGGEGGGGGGAEAEVPEKKDVVLKDDSVDMSSYVKRGKDIAEDVKKQAAKVLEDVAKESGTTDLLALSTVYHTMHIQLVIDKYDEIDKERYMAIQTTKRDAVLIADLRREIVELRNARAAKREIVKPKKNLGAAEAAGLRFS